MADETYDLCFNFGHMSMFMYGNLLPDSKRWVHRDPGAGVPGAGRKCDT
jgi:hypothetical protein